MSLSTRAVNSVIVTLLVTAFSTGIVSAQKKKTNRIGQIFIVGNTETPQWVIERQLPLYPGCKLQEENLRKAETNLERLGLFRKPTVTLVEGEKDAEYVDILVTVQEKRWNWLLFSSQDLVEARLTWDMEQATSALLRMKDRVGDILRP